ncbi:TetR/AcrR family transcriptional regulator [Photobacterium rosenbergii]|uniref:TetR/AcrR family transcriptional regulator n=1 Tax=Photobacterium rosenbergii TaxID=294936 RepID=A0ABU3ZDB6_9GAMM|nr:TetR/AcrR family transcriptional regulator [Photobacterium rosenbergii]MDV5168086.1 TetR/AcrR family transcriptional regulator [Photobacterium rosenbergii]
MSKKRQLLVDTALGLFYGYGIKSIGINEVLKVSGVAKRTLYSHFESKDDLVVAALAQRHQGFMSWLERKLSEVSSDEEVITYLFQALDDWFNDKEAELGHFRGCFFINTSAEFSDLDSDIAKYCRYHKEQVREVIAQKLSGEHPLLLDAICIMKEGAITTAHLTGNGTDVTRKCIAVLKSILQ